MEIQLLLKAGLRSATERAAERLQARSERRTPAGMPSSLSSAAWNLFHGPRITALEDTLSLSNLTCSLNG